jgi:hypothetical protein
MRSKRARLPGFVALSRWRQAEPVVEASDQIARAGNGVGVRKRPISVLYRHRGEVPDLPQDHILPRFGDTPLNAITRAMVKTWSAPKTRTKSPRHSIMTMGLLAGQATCGRYWDRTSDLSGVNGALSR